MDYGERIAKVEAVVESHKEQLSRIEQELVRLREYTDRGFAEIRTSIDSLRGEMISSFRWQTRLTITLFIAMMGMFMAILGMLAKLSGIL
jgi:hypothetical protein